MSYVDQATTDLMLGIFVMFLIIFLMDFINKFLSKFFKNVFFPEKNRYDKKNF